MATISSKRTSSVSSPASARTPPHAAQHHKQLSPSKLKASLSPTAFLASPFSNLPVSGAASASPTSRSSHPFLPTDPPLAHRTRHPHRRFFPRSPQACFLFGALVSQSLVFLLHSPLSLRSDPRRLWPFPGSFPRHIEAAERMGSFRPRFVLFGDSLTQHSFGAGGWGAALQNQYARKADVVVRGYSGYNTRWALFLLPKVFPLQAQDSPPVTLATVFFGANDAVLPDRGSRKQFVPVQEYKENLIKIVKAIQESSRGAKVVLITPPPVDEAARLRYARQMYGDKAVTEPERTNENTGKYAEACKAVAAQLGVPVVDLWARLQQRDSWQSLLNDGLHFTPEGNSAVFDELYKVVGGSFPELQWDVLPWDFPEHSAIDGDKPALAFQ